MKGRTSFKTKLRGEPCGRAVGNRAGGRFEAITADAIYKIVRGTQRLSGLRSARMRYGPPRRPMRSTTRPILRRYRSGWDTRTLRRRGSMTTGKQGLRTVPHSRWRTDLRTRATSRCPGSGCLADAKLSPVAPRPAVCSAASSLAQHREHKTCGNPQCDSNGNAA